MSIRPEELFRAKALAASGVTALIGSGSAARWYPSMAPQDPVYPCVVSGVKSDAPMNHMTGASGWTQAELMIGIYALTYEAAQSLAEQLRIAINPFKGSVTVGVETVKAGLIKLQSQADAPVPPSDGSEKPIYGIVQNWRVSMEQATS